MNTKPVTVGVYRGKEKQFYSPIGISSDNVRYSLDFSFGSKFKIKMLQYMIISDNMKRFSLDMKIGKKFYQVTVKSQHENYQYPLTYMIENPGKVGCKWKVVGILL